MIFFWIVVIIVVVWWLASRSKNSPSISLGISEESVFQMQGAFEKKVGEENYSFLPDSLSGQEIHIYYNLMRRWFNELSAKNRYDDSMIQKLRRD